MEAVDDGYDLMTEYDSLPHRYGDVVLYQAESKVIQYIGHHKSVTLTENANTNGKTSSTYSQIIRKLRQKGWVKQVRNEHNNRERSCYKCTFQSLAAGLAAPIVILSRERTLQPPGCIIVRRNNECFYIISRKE